MMNAVRKRKLILWLFSLAILSSVSLLAMYALRQNISLFYTPSQVFDNDKATNQTIRLGGMVVKGSVKRLSDDLSVQFKLSDFKRSILVSYHGSLPDLFREGQGIVATGRLIDKSHFKASQILAKHDENYMPKELKDTLAALGKTKT